MRARNYRTVKPRPYTRKKFVRGFPPPKITKFTMGDTASEFEYKVRLVARKKVQIRSNALEAARIATNRHLGQKLLNRYCIRILPYPHIILRENKMVFGAHADRISDGMRRSFGKPTGTAASVKSNQDLITVNVNGEGLEVAKEALKLGGSKLPVPCRMVIEKVQKEETKES